MQLLDLPKDQLYILGFMIVALIFSLGAIFYFKRKVKKQELTPVKWPQPTAPASTATVAPTLKEVLGKTRKAFSEKIDSLILKTKVIDDRFIEQLEELLYTSDLGPATVESLLLSVREKLSRGELSDIQIVKKTLFDSMSNILKKSAKNETTENPHVILVVGVNGVGKTTSIGKLAYYYNQKGKKVMVVAADTFRAAAQEQLQVWATRAGSHYYTTTQTDDPAAVAFQGLQKAISEGDEVVIIDTAGRLHNKENLMEELKKVKKVIQKILPQAPHQTLLVIDANSGQNAIQQAKLFNEALGLTGLVVTKLDGSAKGGVVVGIAQEVGLSPEFIGLGEKITDLEPFSPSEFARGLLEI